MRAIDLCTGKASDQETARIPQHFILGEFVGEFSKLYKWF